MNKQRFLQRLDELLQNITEEERVEAIRFYSEYFDEAGEGEEEQLLAQLGSPEKVAAIIRANVPSAKLEGTDTESGETPQANGPRLTTEGIDWEAEAEARAAHTASAANPDDIPLPVYAQAAPAAPAAPRIEQPGYDYAGETQHGGRSSSEWLVIILLLVFLSPLWVGLLGCVFGVLAAMLMTGVVFVFSGIVCILMAVFVLVVNGALAFVNPGTGLILLAVLLVVGALGLCFIVGGIWLLKTMPVVYRFTKSLWNQLLGRGRRGTVQ